MPTSPESFSQVKNILRKLDESIDAARGRRLEHTRPERVMPPVPAPQPMPTMNPNRARPLRRPEGM